MITAAFPCQSQHYTLFCGVAGCFASACVGYFQDDHLWRQGVMDLVFWDAGVAKRYCSRNSSKVRQCWLDGVLFIACSHTLWRDSFLDP